MKTFLYLIILTFTFINLSTSQENNIIKLLQPNLTRGGSLMLAFKERASSREFDTTKLILQDLSDLLWAANGINRTEEGKRTAPSAMNAQDIDIYVFMQEGIFIFEPKENILKCVINKDKRDLFSGPKKDPVNIPIILLLVSDISKFKRGADSLKLTWAAMDAGIVSQNISLFCAGNGLLTRPRAGMPQEEIRKILNLKSTQYPMLNLPVSYKKK